MSEAQQRPSRHGISSYLNARGKTREIIKGWTGRYKPSERRLLHETANGCENKLCLCARGTESKALACAAAPWHLARYPSVPAGYLAMYPARACRTVAQLRGQRAVGSDGYANPNRRNDRQHPDEARHVPVRVMVLLSRYHAVPPNDFLPANETTLQTHDSPLRCRVLSERARQQKSKRATKKTIKR